MPSCNNQFSQILEQIPTYFEKSIPLKMFKTDAWLPLIVRKPWIAGSGSTITTVHTEPTIADDVDTWVSVSDDDDTANNQSCSIDGATIPAASTKRTVSLEQKAVNSQEICYLKTMLAYEFKTQLENTLRNFENEIARIQALRIQNRYSHICGHKVIAEPSLTETGSEQAWSTTAPTMELTQDILRYLYQQLIHGRGSEGAYGTDNGAPVFLLMSDMLTLDNIIKANDHIRSDFRWADAPELLRPLGVSRVYGGFSHYVLREQRRFDIVGGAWVERPKYIAQPTSTGSRKVLNPAWQDAEFGESYIFHKDAMHCRYLSDGATLGAGTQFDPQSFLGEVRWIKFQPTRGCIVDGDVGIFRARMVFGWEPYYPEVGYAIRHKIVRYA